MNYKCNSFFLVLLFTGMLMTACTEEDTPTPDGPDIEEPTPDEEEPDGDPDDEEPAETNNFFKLIRVENFAGDTLGNDPNQSNATVFYSLEGNKAVPVSYGKTNRWDMGFTGLYNSFITDNNGTHTRNPGYGNNAIGGIMIVEELFEDVIDVPDDSRFLTHETYGTDYAGSFATGIGWYLYDFGGTMGGDAHICYPMYEPLTKPDGTVTKPRTIIIRTALGNYAKIKMISIYKDAPDPFAIGRFHPHPYFTFEYVLVPRGSEKFEIKE